MRLLPREAALTLRVRLATPSGLCGKERGGAFCQEILFRMLPGKRRCHPFRAGVAPSLRGTWMSLRAREHPDGPPIIYVTPLRNNAMTDSGKDSVSSSQGPSHIPLLRPLTGLLFVSARPSQGNTRNSVNAVQVKPSITSPLSTDDEPLTRLFSAVELPMK